MDERRFSRTVASLEPLFGFIDAFAAREGLSTSVALDLRLAIEELFVNCVKYHRESEEAIRVRLERDGLWVRATLQDYNVEAWDVTAAPAPDVTAPLEDRSPGGLGLYLVRRVTDEFHYEYRDRSSTVTLAKRVAP